VAPGREVFKQLTNREYDVIGEAQVLYFRDIYDHLVRLTAEFDNFRELTAATILVAARIGDTAPAGRRSRGERAGQPNQ
jgi:Mg2+ and Co2+ transporter CorA